MIGVCVFFVDCELKPFHAELDKPATRKEWLKMFKSRVGPHMSLGLNGMEYHLLMEYLSVNGDYWPVAVRV